MSGSGCQLGLVVDWLVGGLHVWLFLFELRVVAVGLRCDETS